MNGFERWFNGVPKILKCILAFLGIGIVARIFKYIETKDASPLVGAILMIVPIVGLIICIIDLITQIAKDDFTLLYAAGSLDDLTKKEEKRVMQLTLKQKKLKMILILLVKLNQKLRKKNQKTLNNLNNENASTTLEAFFYCRNIIIIML